MGLLDLTAGPAMPSWLPLAMVGVLLGLLYWNMASHLKKIRFAESPASADPDDLAGTEVAGAEAAPASAPSAE